MINFSPKDIRDLEKWANGLSRLSFLDLVLVTEAQNIVGDLKKMMVIQWMMKK